MSDPARWLDANGDAPEGVRSLLTAARPQPMLTAAIRAAASRRIATTVATSALVGSWWSKAIVGAGTIGIASVIALVGLHATHGLDARPRLALQSPLPLATRSVSPIAGPPPTHVDAPPVAVPPQAPVALSPPSAPSPRATAAAPEPRRPTEGELLETAHRELLRGDTSGALAALRAHARLYPQGDMSEEREFLTFRVDQRISDHDAAHAAGTRYLDLHPHGIYAPQVRRELDNPP